jgi:hypothetical protein
MLSAEDVVAVLAANPAVMSFLDSGVCAIEHVSQRDSKGADERLDSCPCDREADDGAELGGGQYVSSERHTIGDLVRDAMNDG